MRYIKGYEIFEEETKEVDLSDELKSIGSDLNSNKKKMQDLVLNIAESDPELNKKIEELRDKKNKDKSQNESLFNQDVNEGVTLGLILSSGAIMELVGKLLKFLGKKFDKNDATRLQKVGESIEKYGHKVHHKLIELVNVILKPLIFWMPKKKQETVSNVVFMTVLAIKISSGSIDPSDYQTAGQLAEGVLNTIKVGEIGAFLKDAGKGLIELVKFI